MSTQTFFKVFLFSINKEKQKLFFFFTTGPAHGIQPAYGRFWPEQPSEEKVRRRSSGLRPKADLTQQKGEGKTATPRRRSGRHDSAAAGRRPVLTTTGHSGASMGSARGRRTQECDSRGERRSGARVPAGGARARRLRPWWCARECSIEPYRHEQDGDSVITGKQRSGRSLSHGESSVGEAAAALGGGRAVASGGERRSRSGSPNGKRERASVS
jgi:hypothetical protein